MTGTDSVCPTASVTGSAGVVAPAANDPPLEVSPVMVTGVVAVKVSVRVAGCPTVVCGNWIDPPVRGLWVGAPYPRSSPS